MTNLAEILEQELEEAFEVKNKRFSMMFIFMNIGFSILVLITIIFKFISQSTVGRRCPKGGPQGGCVFDDFNEALDGLYSFAENPIGGR